MIFTPDTKIVGDVYNPETGLYLDLPADVQFYPQWWKHEPRLYERLVALRKEAGITVEDDLLFGSEEDMEGLMNNDELLKMMEEDDGE